MWVCLQVENYIDSEFKAVEFKLKVLYSKNLRKICRS